MPSTATRPIKAKMYFSRRRELRLVKVPVYSIYGQAGVKQGETKGQTLAFKDGRLDVPTTGEYAFDNGERVPAEEIAEWLEQHRLADDKTNGFWRVDPAAPAVTTEDTDAVLDLGFALDLEGLKALRASEEDGWARLDLLATIDKTIEKVEQVKVQQAAAQAAKAAPKPGPKQ